MSKIWNSGRDRRQEKRCSARYLLLRYRRTSANFDPNEIRRLAAQQKAFCTVVREQDFFGESTDYLAFIDFTGKRFQTRNDKLFDVQGCRPQWFSVTRSPCQTYDWCKGRGLVLIDDAMQKRASRVDTTTFESDDWKVHHSSGDQNEFFKHCENILPPSLQQPLRDMEAEVCPPTAKRLSSSAMSEYLKAWGNGFKAGFEAAAKATETVPDPWSSCKQRKVSRPLVPTTVSEAHAFTRGEQIGRDKGVYIDIAEVDADTEGLPAFSMEDLLMGSMEWGTDLDFPVNQTNDGYDFFPHKSAAQNIILEPM